MQGFGGKTSDGIIGGSILDARIDSSDQRLALCIGAANEVDRFNEYLLNVVNGDAKEEQTRNGQKKGGCLFALTGCQNDIAVMNKLVFIVVQD